MVLFLRLMALLFAITGLFALWHRDFYFAALLAGLTLLSMALAQMFHD